VIGEMIMDIETPSSDAGYSPPIRIQLYLHGNCIELATVGRSGIRLRNPHFAPPGAGVIRLDIDGRCTTYHVELPLGLKHENTIHPIIVLSTAAEAVA
jgi:hypothetical protein